MEFKAINQDAPLSYETIRNTIYEWRRSGTNSSNFNSIDIPGHLFFKIVFHFWNGDAYGTGDGLENGLLAPSWNVTYASQSDDKAGDGTSKGSSTDTGNNTTTNQDTGVVEITKYRDTINSDMEEFMKSQNEWADHASGVNFKHLYPVHNSAYNYLVRNDELERAEKLKQFIILLSNISTYSPWYFYEISGLDGVIERPNKVGEDNYKIEAPKQITIKCLPDSGDHRIATLLDLYRDVSYSSINNRWVLPGNMRRFDMSIYIFDSPISNLHFSGEKTGVMIKNSSSKDSTSSFPVSYKCIELHDCEIDYNSTKTGYSSLTNENGFQQVFEIPISIGNAVETRYNQYLDRTIGDLVVTDLFRPTYSGRGTVDNHYVDTPQSTSQELITALQNRLSTITVEKSTPLARSVTNNIYGKNTATGGSINLYKIVDDLTGNKASTFISSQLLGNIYKTSISDLTDNLKNLSKNIAAGSLGGVRNNINQVSQVKNGWYTRDLGNIHGSLNK